VAETKIETESGDLLRIPQTDTVEPPCPGQELLRQWRTVIRLMCLGPDQDDPSAVAFAAKRFGRPQTGHGSGTARRYGHGR